MNLEIKGRKEMTDTQRLDWLSRRERVIEQDYESGLWKISQFEGNVNDRELVEISEGEYKTLREAIDASMWKV